MRHAIVKNGVVESVVVWDGVSKWAAPQGTQAIPCGDEVGPGFTYDGKEFIAPPKQPVPPVVPVVTMRQARLALLSVGKLAAVEAAIQQAGDAAKIEWEYAQELRRDHPLVVSMGAALNLDGAALDQLFVQAATL